MLTADNVEIKSGMEIFVTSGREITVHKAGEVIEPYKVVYDEPDQDGYIGTRRDNCFATKEKAQEHIDSQYITMILDEDDARLFSYAVSRLLVKHVGELQVLRITKERELKDWERHMLPLNLQQSSREELQEQIDPWISLVDSCQYAVDKLEKELEKFNKEGRQ